MNRPVYIYFILFCISFLPASCFEGNDDDDGGTTTQVWTDPETGLNWQVVPSAEYTDWNDAHHYCKKLILAGHDDWRLPTISELRTLIRGCPATEDGGSCGVTDECPEAACQNISCYQCKYGNGPNDGCFGAPELQGGCEYYRSASPVTDSIDRAWSVGMSNAFIYKPRLSYAFRTRCVR